MNMPLAKTTSTLPTPAPSPASSAAVVPLPKSSRSFLTDTLLPKLRAVAARVIPPFIMLVLIFGIWQILCMKPGATLPVAVPYLGRCQGPDHRSVLCRRTAGHRARSSRPHVASACRSRLWSCQCGGCAGRRDYRPVGLGDARSRSDLPGDAHRSAAGLVADFARGLPRQQSLGDLRDLHHLDLADHHQHRGRHPQHSAGLSQRRRRGPAESARVLLENHDPVGGTLHLHGSAHRHRPVMARHRRGRNAHRRRRSLASSSGTRGIHHGCPTSSWRSPTSASSDLCSIAWSPSLRTSQRAAHRQAEGE